MVFSFLGKLFSGAGRADATGPRPDPAYVDAKIPDDLRSSVTKLLRDREAGIYMVRMFWQKRFDKIYPDDRVTLDWITRTFLAADIVADHYQTPTPHGPLCLEGLNHTEMAQAVVTNAYLCRDIQDALRPSSAT